MGHHIVAGRFQSDRHPDLPPDVIRLSSKDQAARRAFAVYLRHAESAEAAAKLRRQLDAGDDFKADFNFADEDARRALRVFAIFTEDSELGRDVRQRIGAIEAAG